MDKSTIVQQTVAQFWNVCDEYKNHSLEQLKQKCKDDVLPFSVCAINITGDLNLGIMLRTASLLGARRFIIYGKKNFDRRSTVGAQNYIEVVRAGTVSGVEVDYSEFYPLMEALQCQPIFFDTGGCSLWNFDINESCSKEPCLVFGNEGFGLPQELTLGQKIITIPQRGVLRSFNVSAAASIAMSYFSTELKDKS